jgi:anti-sigma regulatory factor (Ser/Thr protein kinase)
LKTFSKVESNASATFKANLQSLPMMLEFVRSHIRQVGFDRKSAQRIEIAVEEALVNVINHAYVNKSGSLELAARLIPKQHIQFTIKDNGIPFNPLDQVAEIDTSLSLEEREVGGLGIKLMREFMDDLHYERGEACNILTLGKNVKSRNFL